MERIVIVGASLAGQRTLRGLHRGGHEGDIVMVGAEPHLPYDRPPLSKQFLAGTIDRERLDLAPSTSYDAVDVRAGVVATRLRVADRTVELSDGSEVSGDHVVVATGGRARTLPGQPDLDGLQMLRTVDDAIRLRQALDDATRLVVVGAGFIGSEVASTAIDRGLEVVVLEADTAPLARVMGPVVGAALGRLQPHAGVDLRLDAAVAGVVGDGGRVTGVELVDGARIDADVVLVGIGAVPVTDWLVDSGLAIDNGVHCDAGGRAVGGDGHVWAVGDVAAWPHGTDDVPTRMEHWTGAIDQAAVVATNLLGGDAVLEAVPFVWSDQFGHKIQVVGTPRHDDRVIPLLGDPDVDLAGWVVAHVRDDRVVAVTGVDQPRVVATLRRSLVDAPTLVAVQADVAALG